MADPRALTVWRQAPGRSDEVLCTGTSDGDVVTFLTMQPPFRLPDEMPYDELVAMLANASQSGFLYRIEADGEVIWPVDPASIEG